MAKVYVLENNEKTFNKLVKDLKFEAIPPSIVKDLTITDRESGAVKSVISLLNNPTWQNQYLDKHLLKQMKKENILFKKKQIVLNEEFYNWAVNWVICCNLHEDGMIGITFNFERYPFTFYDVKYLDEYCPDLIKELKKSKLVKVKEVENSAE